MNVLAVCYIHWMVLYALLSHNCLYVRDKKCCVRFTATLTRTHFNSCLIYRLISKQAKASFCLSLSLPCPSLPSLSFLNVYEVPRTGFSFLAGYMCSVWVCGTRILKTLAFKDGKPKNLHINEMYKHRLFEKWLCEHFAQTPNATRELIIFVSDVFFVTIQKKRAIWKTGNNKRSEMGTPTVATGFFPLNFSLPKQKWRSKVEKLRKNEILTIQG